MRHLRRYWLAATLALAFVMLAPLTAAAITNSEVIAILNVGVAGLRDLVRDAYCASGINSFCP